MSPLERFKRPPALTLDTRVLGTHLLPMRLFGLGGAIGGAGLRPGDEDEATKVIRALDVLGEEVLVTRMGGLFVRPPLELTDVYVEEQQPTPAREKLDYIEHAAELFNLVTCELALRGVPSAPVSMLHIARGDLVDGYAAIVTAAMAPDPWRERTTAPARELEAQSDWWFRWSSEPEAVLDAVGGADAASRLREIAPRLPSAVAMTCSLASQRLVAAATAQAADVIEALRGELTDEELREVDAARALDLEAARAVMGRMAAAIAGACDVEVQAPEVGRPRMSW
jgi:hypothetical protein